MGALKVSAIVVTRGDVDLELVLDSFPEEWEQLVWDNGRQRLYRRPGTERRKGVWEVVLPVADLSVYGRYAAIEHATGDVIYVQDDDCVVGYPQGIVEQFVVPLWARADYVVCNMPQEFRHDFYQEHALVGFGAAFHRDAPARAFERYERWAAVNTVAGPEAERHFYATCDIVFTALTPKILVDAPKVNLPWATDDGRMYRQPEHLVDRTKMLEWAKAAKDAR